MALTLREKVAKTLTYNQSVNKSAKRLGISREEYIRIKNELLNSTTDTNSTSKEEGKLVENYNLEKGEGHLTGLISDRPLSPEEIEIKYKINTAKWRLSGYWNKEQPNGRFLISANVTQLKGDKIDPAVFQKQFLSFLSTYTPRTEFSTVTRTAAGKQKIALVLPKQDAHFNKYDIMGNNNIQARFDLIKEKTVNIVERAYALNELEEIIYVVGSDQFNSEWTNMTTNGTPQQNILTYEGAFTEICNHELDVIEYLTTKANTVRVVFVPGNHDHHVGWHLITWLQGYLRLNAAITFDTSVLSRKYAKYGNTAMMLNHGEAMKASELAYRFPKEFKDEWSSCDHFYGFTGDKHHEKSVEVHGITFYQIGQLSKATSMWDDKKGFTTTTAQMNAFVITKTNGMGDILKSNL